MSPSRVGGPRGKRAWLTAGLLLLHVLPVAARAQYDGNMDEAKVPAYRLPDPLVMQNGARVTSPAMWWEKRRPELLKLFQENIYGVSPPAPTNMRFVITDLDSHALGGIATRKQVTIYLDGRRDGPQTSLLLYLPNQVHGQAPVFVGLNFHGNQAIDPDPAIAIAHSWVVDAQGIVGHRATAGSRGIDASEWPLRQILSAGYGVATYFPGDLYPDGEGELSESVQPFYGTSPSAPNHRGAIATWAWGLSRAYDYLATDAQVDSKRVIVFGHSRYGKAALWAVASDPRFAMVISNDSGGGGAKLFRRMFGETVRVMNNYWFCPEYKTYSGRDGDLPVDQHELIALIAPTPVYVASATEDLWSDPRGEFLSAKGADPVYRFLGTDGLGITAMPPPDQSVQTTIGYHIRTGKHEITPFDWAQYLRFADAHLGGSREKPNVPR